MPFQLAKMAHVPVVPIGLSGLYRFKRCSSWLLRPGIIKLHIGQPIPVEEIEGYTVEGLRRLMRERISELIEFP
jgi:1-acyl-sn-glycerol-3-phosphate acyltransferase